MSALHRAIVACCLMIVTAVGAWALVPRHKLADQLGPLNLEEIIPMSFGDWETLPKAHGGIVNPQQAELLSQIYTQTLARTYVNRRTGEAMMLSIAYGEDQRDGMQLHYPEVCYPAQGFQVLSNRKGSLSSDSGEIPVRHLETYAGQRFEPITYWTVVGEHATLGGLDKKFAEMKYSLRGQIPDGLLFRVSSISRDSDAAFRQQGSFARELLQAVSATVLPRVAGPVAMRSGGSPAGKDSR
ncbi:MAG: EpsI family protein [Candidatus Dactylopiibacterium carminicum]|uniref:EpsI family protein n=1 Tax=Candidatus Dactylopiibacterium carminicum TaxID=857335 RepID=A0A272EP98_9RHOO|nr:exosortase-associated protein EpsI, B-type [Candidatus Dactylopiibacterium carminicum]KAF7598259.1 EpsI family protein [Candidatus Dactylopiibacterium carminicum]PAS91942.1 MAG: EpsI family protein [Candidatus Dactylopiibacterium carminicum]PAS94996.1 MAG: EpsI family protein [Candidatus Dactylopiibacterium carminicum]PAS97142.1 MAG: EpsI family protein [Candidatus Dactylopiibacterium carminicum]